MMNNVTVGSCNEVTFTDGTKIRFKFIGNPDGRMQIQLSGGSITYYEVVSAGKTMESFIEIDCSEL